MKMQVPNAPPSTIVGVLEKLEKNNCSQVQFLVRRECVLKLLTTQNSFLTITVLEVALI